MKSSTNPSSTLNEMISITSPIERDIIAIFSCLDISEISVKFFLSLFENNERKLKGTVNSLRSSTLITVKEEFISMKESTRESVRHTLLKEIDQVVDVLKKAIKLALTNMDSAPDIKTLFVYADSIFTKYREIKDVLNSEQRDDIEGSLLSLLSDVSSLDNVKNSNDRTLILLDHYLHITYSEAFNTKKAELANILVKIGDNFASQADYVKALSTYKGALRGYEDAYGPEHEYVAKTLAKIASAHTSLYEYHEAERLYLEALIILKNTDGKENIVSSILAEYGHIHLLHGKNTEAKAKAMVDILSCLYHGKIPQSFFSPLFENNAELAETINLLERYGFITVTNNPGGRLIHMSISEKELVKTTLNVVNKVDALRNAIQLVRDNMDYFSKILNDDSADLANLFDHVGSIFDTYEGIEDLLNPEELAPIKELAGSFFLDASRLFRVNNKDNEALFILERCIDILSRGVSDTKKNMILADALFDMDKFYNVQKSYTKSLSPSEKNVDSIPETNQKVDTKEMSHAELFNEILAPKLSMFLDRLPPKTKVMINIWSYLYSTIPITAFLSLFENNKQELSETIKLLEGQDFITVDKDSGKIFIDSLTQELVRNKLNRANQAVESLEKAIQLVRNNMGGLSDTSLFDNANSIVTNYEAIKNELNLEQQNIIDNLLLKLLSDASGDNDKDDYPTPLILSDRLDSEEANPNILQHMLMQLNVKIGLLFKQMLYYNEIARLHAILREKNIDTHIDWENYPDFRKNVMFRLHPDKGGNDGDFTFAKELYESMNEDLNIQPIIHKASIGFKALDTVTDTIRLIDEPNFANTKKVAFDFNYLYGIYSGVNSFSLVMSGADSLYQFTQGEYEQAVKQMVVTAGYMALPAMIAFANMPYIALAYGAVVNSYTIYHAGINTYSLYQEYNTIESQLKSAIAYKDLYNIFAGSPFQQIYDFASNAKLYEVRIKTISLEIEKAHVKQELEAKEEFGNKLYKYIYVPMLEEKYGLLELKHATLKISGQYYEHCFSIISENNDEGLYTCYNMEEKIIDHVTIMNNGSAEVIGCL